MKQTETKPKMVTPIERLIRERGLKPGWVASKCNMGYAQLRALRIGEREPKAGELVRLSRLFGVSIEELINSAPIAPIRHHADQSPVAN